MHIFIEGCQLKSIPTRWHVLELGLGSARKFPKYFRLGTKDGCCSAL